MPADDVNAIAVHPVCAANETEETTVSATVKMKTKMIEVRWHGRAGQGAKTAALLAAQAVIREGKWSQAFPEFGPERRGAPMQSFTRVSTHPILLHSSVTEPDVVVVLSEGLLHLPDVLRGLKLEGTILINSPLQPEAVRESWKLKVQIVASVDASRISWDCLGRDMPNTPMLGALSRVTGLVTLESLQADMQERLGKKFAQRPKVVESNLRAVRQGFEEVQEHRLLQSNYNFTEDKTTATHLPTWQELPIGGIIPEPGTAQRYFTGGWRLQRPEWDFSKCAHCLICWVMCPDDAILVRDGKIVGLDEMHCKGCGICAVECPPKIKAIKMVEEPKNVI